MANASEKKRSSSAAATIELYKQILMGIYATFFLVRIVFFWSSFTLFNFFLLLIMSALNFFCLGMVQQSLELGTPPTGPQDVLFVNWIVMGLSIFWDRAYILYLTIPAYLLYQYGGWLKNYFFPPRPVEAPLSDADLKRQAKKERQATRQAKFAGR